MIMAVVPVALLLPALVVLTDSPSPDSRPSAAAGYTSYEDTTMNQTTLQGTPMSEQVRIDATLELLERIRLPQSFGGTIAFGSSGTMHLIDMTTGQHVRYTGVPGMLNPSFVPQQRRLIFGQEHIFALSLDEKVITRLSPHDGPSDQDSPSGSNPSVSPDAGQVVYVSRNDINLPQLAMLNLSRDTQTDSAQTRMLPQAGFRTSTDPAWSPDGTQLAFIASEQRTPQLLVIDRTCLGDDTCEPVTLTQPVTGTRSPAWSPDGEHIAYVTMQQGERSYFAVQLITTDGSIRQLTPPDVSVFNPAWSPDGVFIACMDAGRFGDETITLVVMQPDGSDAVRIEGVGGGAIDWSPLSLDELLGDA